MLADWRAATTCGQGYWPGMKLTGLLASGRIKLASRGVDRSSQAVLAKTFRGELTAQANAGTRA